MSKLSWKPRKYTRDGIERYCAPACGHHCTRFAYETALSKAKQAARELGPGWKPVVSENLGWHARIECGKAHLSLFHTIFWCSMVVGGRQWQGEGRTAKAAYTRMIRGARRHIAELEREIRAHEKANGRR